MATSSRDGQNPPTNLKERIAQLQQRNVSSPTPSASPPNEKPGAAPPGGGSLRDRIARFEKKGSVPAPRGSFAMGAPPVENGPKKMGELYGNRIQGLGNPSSRPTSPDLLDGQPKQRSASSFAAVGEEVQDGTVSPLPKSASTTPSRSNSLIPPANLAAMRSVSSPEIPQARDATLDPGVAKPLSPSPATESDTPPVTIDAPSAPVGASSDEAPASVFTEELQETPSDPSKVARASSESTSTAAAASLPSEAPAPTSFESTPAAATASLPAQAPTTTSAPAPVSAPAPTSPSTPAAPKLAPVTKPASVLPAPPSPAPQPVKPPSSGPSQTVVRNITRTTSPPVQFSAVVHRKVTETTPSPTATPSPPASLATPKAVPARRAKVPVTVETPSSPAVELAALLENAFLLEAHLDGGGRSSDSQSLKTPTVASFPASVSQPPQSTVAEPEVLSTPTAAAPAGGSTGEGEGKTLSPKESLESFSAQSIPSIREPTIDQDIPEESEPDFGAQSIRSHGGDMSERASVRSKSSTTRHYFSSLRRLASGGSQRRSSTYNGYTRDSMSFSSEDSGVVVIPPSEDGTVQWPTSAPQSRKGSVGRSSSFADKLFNRGRTRSNNSETDNQSIQSYGSSLSPSSPSKGAKGKSGHGKAATDSGPTRPPKFDLDAFPSVPGNIPTNGSSSSKRA